VKLKPLLAKFYAGNYKRYLALPAVLFVVFAFLAFISPGLEYGIDLKGGTLVVIGTKTTVNAVDLEQAINADFDLTELQVTPFQGGVQVQFGFNRELDEIKQAIELAKTGDSAQCRAVASTLAAFVSVESIPEEHAECIDFVNELYGDAEAVSDDQLDETITAAIGAESIREGGFTRTEISPALGQLFWSNAQMILVIALISVVIVIFLFFRAFVPSIAVLSAAGFDILAALGLMALFNVNFSLASISALLMLVGYSVDTDIMLTTRLLKRKFKSTRENATDCLVTGLTMTGTTLGAVTVMLVLSAMWNLGVIYSIAIVLLFGLLGDIVSTWFMNGPVLMMYLEWKAKK